MKDVSNATAYAVLIPQLMKAGREVGYAIAIHGSWARDLDVVAVPWTEEAVTAERLILQEGARSVAQGRRRGRALRAIQRSTEAIVGRVATRGQGKGCEIMKEWEYVRHKVYKRIGRVIHKYDRGDVEVIDVPRDYGGGFYGASYWFVENIEPATKSEWADMVLER